MLREEIQACSEAQTVIHEDDSFVSGFQLSGHDEARETAADDDDIRIDKPSGTGWLHFRRQTTEARYFAGKALNDRSERRDIRHEVVMIEAVREEPIVHPQKICFARSHDVLRFDSFIAQRRFEARHHVGGALNAHQTAFATSAHARRAAWSMQLRTSRKDGFSRGQKRNGQGLAAFRGQR